MEQFPYFITIRRSDLRMLGDEVTDVLKLAQELRAQTWPLARIKLDSQTKIERSSG